MMSALHSIKFINTDTNTEIKIEYPLLKKILIIIRFLNHKHRQQIIKMLEEKDAMTVTEIYMKLRIEQSVASQHIAILKKAGVLKFKKEAKFIYYSLQKSRLNEIDNLIKKLFQS